MGMHRFADNPRLRRSVLRTPLLLCLLIPKLAFGLELESLTQGWQVAVQAPELKTVERTSSEHQFRYFGKTDNGVFISLHVETLPTQVRSNRDCIEHYWPNRSPNSLQVDLASINFTSRPVFEAVSYNFRIYHAQRVWHMPNTHFYFAVNGRCADLHVGATPTYRDFHQLVQSIATSLKVKPLSVVVRAQPSDAPATAGIWPRD